MNAVCPLTSNPCYLPFCLGLLSHSRHLSWNLVSFLEPLLVGVPSRVSPSLSPDKPHSQVQAGNWLCSSLSLNQSSNQKA